MPCMRELVLLTSSLETKLVLTKQLEEILEGFVTVRSYSLVEGLPERISNRLVILSHPHAVDFPQIMQCVGEDCKVIAARRIVNFENIERLLFYPKGTHMLYINDTPETCKESIDSLMKLGIDHIHYVPFYPGIRNSLKIEKAIAPGGFKHIPEHVTEVVDIGPRLIDISTIMQILDHFGLNEPGNSISQRFMRKIIQLSKGLTAAIQKANEVNHHLNQVLDGVNEGILTIQQNGVITVFNDELGQLLNIIPSRAIGRRVQDLLDHQELVTFLLNPSTEMDRWFTFGQTEAVVHRFTINRDQSIVATFKNARKTIEMETALRRELKKKGFVAKYTMSDMIGDSYLMRQTRAIARKLAKTDLTILIQGESGTGKELLASAIHDSSPRRNGPFLAVNFSAISEDLIESELFGYEDGSFTGAKKGGKIGLFEQAHGGTIFLDEIGDISLKLQARLLRVLQEREVMRIGGSKIIPINVRILAATNKNLIKMIEQGTFREDLYHRLKVLFLHIPPLRNRREDIPLLIQHFIESSGNPNIVILPEVISHLCSLNWFGNVRELKNTIDYMLAVSENDTLQLVDVQVDYPLLQRSLVETESLQHSSISVPVVKLPVNPDAEQELMAILYTIYTITQAGDTPTRQRVSEISQRWKNPLSHQQVRRRLDMLESRGLIVKNRGRFGTKLTQAGYQAILAAKERGSVRKAEGSLSPSFPFHDA